MPEGLLNEVFQEFLYTFVGEVGLVIRIHPSCRFVPLRRLTYIVAETQNLLQRNTPQRLLRRLSAFIG